MVEKETDDLVRERLSGEGGHTGAASPLGTDQEVVRSGSEPLVPEPVTGEVVKAPRTESGRFVKGFSGNPAGRTKGIRNKITFERLMLEDALRQTLATKSTELLEKAIDMALEGNDRVMRALLDKVLSTPKHDDPGEAKDNEIKILIQNLTNGSARPEPGTTTVKVTNSKTEVDTDG